MIKVERDNSEAYGRFVSSDLDCGGVIITQTTAITASHCICGETYIREQVVNLMGLEFYEEHVKPWVTCRRKLHGGSAPPNEVYILEYNKYIKQYNKILVKMGGKINSN